MTLSKNLWFHIFWLLAIIIHLAVQSSTRTLIQNNILFTDISNNAWYNKAQSLIGKPFLAAMASNRPGLGPIHVTMTLLKPGSGWTGSDLPFPFPVPVRTWYSGCWWATRRCLGRTPGGAAPRCPVRAYPDTGLCESEKTNHVTVQVQLSSLVSWNRLIVKHVI